MVSVVDVPTRSAPHFTVGVGHARYRGAVVDGTAHRHAAFQIAIAIQGEVTMVDAAATRHRSAVLIVPPMTEHRMFAREDVLTYFVEPHCAFADRLRRRCGVGITAAPELHELRESDLSRADLHPSSELDPRLVAALSMLRGRDAAMPDLARAVGLSPQRLRALSRCQLGLPLTRWRAWARLQRAAEALGAGQSLAGAADTAGFADQAHLTRWMREMMGLTPGAVLSALGDHARRAT